MYLVIDLSTGTVVQRASSVERAYAIACRLTENAEWIDGREYTYVMA